MELDALLKYQSIEKELRKMKSEMLSNESYKVAEEAKAGFNEKKQLVVNSEKVAAKVQSAYDDSVKYYDDTTKKIEKLILRLDDENITDEEAEKIVEQLLALNEKLNELITFIQSTKKKSESAVKTYSDAQKSGKELKVKYNDAKAKLVDVEKKYLPQIEKLEKEQAEAKKAVPADLMARYEKITGEGIFPAFVQAQVFSDKTLSCICGISLSLSSQNELNHDGICVCDKCRRVIYNKN